jgi:hypothetical protein
VATRTLITDANLTAVTFSESPNALLPADLATIANAIRTDPNALNSQNTGRAVIGGAFGYNGLLFLPCNRGVLRVFPGDVVAVDTGGGVGWPILVSADAIVNGSWTLT